MRARVAARNSYDVGRWLFLRLLGLVYLIAFISLWVQVEGLVGSDGILPVADYLDWIRGRTGVERYWQIPTLLWLSSSDVMLHLLCGAGAAASLAVLLGVARRAALVLAWVLYLSLVHAGQTFLSFQWDVLLLETGLCALFVAFLTRPPGRRIALWLLWLLLFKLMFLSGAVKPLSMDATWLGLTALDYHYWTQPLPTWVSWYVDRLPASFDKLSVLLTYAIEIILPFLIFTGPVGRRIVAAGTVFLMLVISWTGNYGFFNLLTIVLCVPLVDDAAWRKLPAWIRPRPPAAAVPSKRRAPRILAAAPVVTAALLIAISALTLVRELARTVPPGAGTVSDAMVVGAERWLLGWSRPTVLAWARPLRSVNGYGLFRAMTTARPEIVIEGSRDGVAWRPYEFRWKPGDPTRRPRFVAPHMPRLDWQMWFAALNPRRAQPWLTGLLRALFDGTPEVLDLLAADPFAGEKPRTLRLVSYRYRFATPAERREAGVWWSRQREGLLLPPITRDDLRRERE